MLKLVVTNKSDKDVYLARINHYTETNGFVGRSIIYKIYYNDLMYGIIAAGSATRFLPGRNEFLIGCELRNIINNCFFHVERIDGKYPCRNFLPKILEYWRYASSVRWFEKYGDGVFGFESLVELPRTGEIYNRDGWTQVGITKGQTCRRWAESIMGPSTDSWGGRRIWNTTNLKPKLVFVRRI